MKTKAMNDYKYVRIQGRNLVTNTPGEIVYEDQYQIVAKVDDIIIQEVPESWSKNK